MSFEHFPPRSAGNQGRAEVLGIDAWLRREDDGTTERGRIVQKGSGAYTLCKACNNRAGRLYVPEFTKLTRTGNRALSALDPAPPEIDQQLESGYLHAEMQEVRPARLMKQIVTMMLAMSPSGFSEKHPDLTAYASEPDRIGLPNRYQLYLAFYAGPIARFNGGSAILHEGKTLFVLSLCFPPFSYVLSIDEEEPAIETGNVTSFTTVGIDAEATITIDLKLGFGHTPLPLDYRTKAALERDRAASKAEAA
jgi:hypothetical protein